MRLKRTSAVLLTALVVGSAVLALPAAGTLATPGNPPQPDTENRPPSDGADFTVTPDDHSPGVSTAYTMLSRGAGPWNGSEGLRRIDYYKITTQATRFQDCSPSDARAFGIDRDNDAPGTKTDVGLLRHMEQYSVNGRVISVDIYDEGDLGGSPTYLNDTDETVAQLANCVVTPSEPGWYQFKGYVNGTNYQGEFQEVLLYSEYFYVCDCSSEAEAEEQLGPKPYSDSSDDSDGSDTDGSGASEPTATRTVTATATATPERGSDGSGASESTATPAPTATPTSAPTATPTSAGNDDSTSGTASTPTGTAAGGGSSGDGTAASATSTAASGDGSERQAEDGGQQGGADRVTPTAGDGPGFGVVAALGGLLAAGLLARRRD